MVDDFSKTPKFLRRLYRETNDSKNDCITWSEDGERLRIIDKEKFIKTTLNRLSKTKEYSGFIRQLHIYGFVKSKSEKNDEIEEYYNCFFKKNQPSLMGFIKREQKAKKNEKNLCLPTMETNINYLTNANFRLSNEILQLKERLDKQERTINGLLDILGRVFRTGAQSMGYETQNTKLKPDLFMKYTLTTDKNEDSVGKSILEGKQLNLFVKDQTPDKNSHSKPQTPQNDYSDMRDIFF